MALFIGAYLPDKQLDDSLFCNAITKVAVKLAQSRHHPAQQSKPNLDLYFLMPGKEEQPDFKGMRLHSFDSENRTLKIESSVPAKMLQSLHAEKFVVASLHDALEGAAEFYAEHSIDFEQNNYFHLLEMLNMPDDALAH